MPKIEPARVWSLNYRLLMSVITAAAPAIAALGLETKELFVLGEVEEHPYPAALAATLCMPKPSVTVYVKRLEAAGFLRREIDPADLRRHRLVLTAAGRKAAAQGKALLSKAFSDRLGRLGVAEQAVLLSLLEKMT
ncbi:MULTISPECIES: MarR family winged helix-turn-helix transcriptional regulator [Anaeromyxobacter]|uniref:MarR family winged helix-turn-helix transcriptional regulator n=1 Tax=Anaeromyxobacter TaxID=161492 RepID=UPI001F574681|nr:MULTISPECIES: MarR family winged helix-turn-helix transcriptional regulator [unclassified Anaeromyxobacter]